MAFPVDETRLEAAERQLGRQLPSRLRQRLLRHNGGEIEADDDDWQLYPVWDATDKRTMKRTANHILRETQLARQSSGFPEDAVAIADNGTGDYLILRNGTDDVELWDHETAETGPVEITWD